MTMQREHSMRTGICGLLSLLLVLGGWPAPALEQLVGAKLAYADEAMAVDDGQLEDSAPDESQPASSTAQAEGPEQVDAADQPSSPDAQDLPEEDDDWSDAGASSDDASPATEPADEVAPLPEAEPELPAQEPEEPSPEDVEPTLEAQATLTYAKTKSEILAILKKYDPDGYYIVKTMDKRGDKVMKWWGSDSYLDAYEYFSGFDTMVHEETHGFTWSKLDLSKKERIYIGGKKSVVVTFTKVFKSKSIAKSVPKALRTNRYYLYVAKPTKNLASNVYGVYGLLNEFTAYCWGMNSCYKLYSYADTFDDTDELWRGYVSSVGSTALAHAEFRYFMEHYLYYAKVHKPKVYKAIMANKGFKKAIKKVDKKFSNLVKAADRRMPAIAAKLRAAGYEVYIEDDYLYIGMEGGYCGSGLSVDEYNKFASALAKKRYKKIEKALGLTAVSKRAPSVD